MSNPRAQTSDELETVEAQNSLFELLYDCSARAVTTQPGQFVYRRIDCLLSIVEKTARWSLPQPASCQPANDDPNKIHISAPPLIRPLPWLLFLPALIALRLVRVVLSFLALMLGKPPVYPVTVVSFLQNKRRKLRALKYRGQRLNRINRTESQEKEDPLPTWLSRVILPIRTVVSTRTSTKHSTQEANHNQHQQHVAKKRNAEERDYDDSDDSFDDADCLELLEKYANVAGDSSFNAEEASDESSDTSLSETDKSIGEAESTQNPAESRPAGNGMNGHTQPEKPTDPQAEPASTKEPAKPQEKSSLNVTKEPKTDVSPKVEKAEEAIAENGSSEPADAKQDSKNDTTVPHAKTTFAAVAPEAAAPNSVSINNNNSKSSLGEMKPQQKIRQHNPQAAPLQPQNYQQSQTITANGGSGGRKHKRPNQNYS